MSRFGIAVQSPPAVAKRKERRSRPNRNCRSHQLFRAHEGVARSRDAVVGALCRYPRASGLITPIQHGIPNAVIPSIIIFPRIFHHPSNTIKGYVTKPSLHEFIHDSPSQATLPCTQASEGSSPLSALVTRAGLDVLFQLSTCHSRTKVQRLKKMRLTRCAIVSCVCETNNRFTLVSRLTPVL